MQTLQTDRRRHHGFTLIEVMVALVIIAISLTGMAVTMGGMLNNATALRERTYASWIAQNKIVEMRVANTAPETGSTSGEIEYANAFWNWRAEVSDTGIENLYRVDVEVSLAEGSDPIRTVTGFLGEPIVPGLSNQVWMQLAPQDGEGPGRDGGVTR